MKGFVEWFGLFVIVPLVLFEFSCPVQAATLHVEASGSVLAIQANAVPLGDVLTAISEKTGLVVNADEPLSEEVTYSFKGLTLKQSIIILLEKRSYALMFEENQDVASAPPMLWVFAFHDVPLKDWFAEKVNDSRLLMRQFSAIPSGAQTGEKGIKITSITSGSVLQKIGISNGDLVSRVNGRPIESVEEFISALQFVPQEAATIMMIERRMPDGRLAPVYVHFD